MKWGIGNVKAKSSGGASIPSIYIEDSQVSVVGYDVSIQFTQAQFDVINANSVIYIEWETGNPQVFEKTEEPDIALLNYWWNSADNELQMTKIYVDDETLIGDYYFNANILSGGGGGTTEYIHNIHIQLKWNNSDASKGGGIINVMLKSSSATPMNTLGDLRQWLEDNGYNENTLAYKGVSGYMSTRNSTTMFYVDSLTYRSGASNNQINAYGFLVSNMATGSSQDITTANADILNIIDNVL